MRIGDQVMAGSNPLASLIQKENFVGWVYGIDYDTAHVLTNDVWKTEALGIPHNCFLVATTFDPESFSQTPADDREVLLFRVIGTSALPHDSDLIRAKIDHFQRQTGTGVKPYDAITQNQMQFGGLECRVLGTFYMEDDALWLGSDLESFAAAARLNVYRPRGEALKTIVNHVDPIRRASALEDAKRFGITGPLEPFPIGTVRYTSTDRLHRREDAELVTVHIQPTDFIARRTAVLGMTRTGKSNMIKQLVSVVKGIADSSGIQIGQIIYDLNGEYANANQQDQGSIADVYPTQTVRYRMMETPGFEELQNNFYVQIREGMSIIRQLIRELGGPASGDVEVFLNTSFDEPPQTERGEHKRWQVKVAAYHALLHRAGFKAPQNHLCRFDANQQVRDAVRNAGATGDPQRGMTPQEAVNWFLAAREANGTGNTNALRSSSGQPWLDADTAAILNMLAQRNSGNTFIRGFNVLTDARAYHSPRRSQDVGQEIYQHLVNGKIVILDLSVGEPSLRERLSQLIAQHIFHASMRAFLRGDTPPNIAIYIEEAHNLIGRDAPIDGVWPRIAKEGAKYRLSLIYATQEVSSMHRNILANTENWFITHLNNDGEVKELGKFYDFADFSRSLIRAQDVGFARVKTLSGPFVVPVQIDRFDPEKNKKAAAKQPVAPVARPTSPAAE